MFSTTLEDLRKAGACYEGYNKVIRAIQGKEFTEADGERESYIRFKHKEPIELISILSSNGLDDALWALRCVPGAGSDARLFAVWCARQVQHLMTDERSIAAIDVAEKFANGLATDKELAAASAAALAAASAAAWDAARAATRAAWAAAWAAARAATRANWAATWDAAWDAAWSAARVAQKEMFIKMCNGSAPWQIKG